MASNRAAFHEETPDPKMAAAMYLAANKKAAIPQKDTPAPRLFIHNPSSMHISISVTLFYEAGEYMFFAGPITGVTEDLPVDPHAPFL